MEIADTGFLRNASKLPMTGVDGKAKNLARLRDGFGGIGDGRASASPCGRRTAVSRRRRGTTRPAATIRMNFSAPRWPAHRARGFEDSVWAAGWQAGERRTTNRSPMTELALKLGREIATPAELGSLAARSARAA